MHRPLLPVCYRACSCNQELDGLFVVLFYWHRVDPEERERKRERRDHRRGMR